jgi:hypothetical protein
MLDMNGTFMFGEDRFGKEENFSHYYMSIGGEKSVEFVNDLGGAHAAGMDCILVGGAASDLAIDSYSSLLEFQQTVQSRR